MSYKNLKARALRDNHSKKNHLHHIYTYLKFLQEIEIFSRQTYPKNIFREISL